MIWDLCLLTLAAVSVVAGVLSPATHRYGLMHRRGGRGEG